MSYAVCSVSDCTLEFPMTKPFTPIVGRLVAILLVGVLPSAAMSLEDTPPLKTEYAFVTHVLTGDALVAEHTPEGNTRYVPIIGGTVSGPGLKGTILSGGDSQVVRSDGVFVIEARYMFKTDDNVLISVLNRGMRHASAAVMARLLKGEHVPADQYYFRTVAQIEAPVGSRYEALNKSLFVAMAEREPTGAVLHFYRID
jgi:hypothetical protein